VTRHRVEMPATPRPWTCQCGTRATLPLAASWAAWEQSVMAHLVPPQPPPAPGANQTACDVCGRLIHNLGLGSHRRHKHPQTLNGKATP